MSLLAEIKARLSAPTPAFWRKVQKRTAATAAAFTSLTVAIASFSAHLPPALATILPTIAGGAAAFFGGVSAVCSLAVDDPAALVLASEPPAEVPTDLPAAS